MVAVLLANGRAVAYVDDEDAERVAGYRWKIKQTKKDKTPYAIAWTNGSYLYMHQVVLPNVERVDHINGNGLDNRRENLRPCTHVENMRNMRPPRGKRFKGVSLCKKNGPPWRAYICTGVGGHFKHLGYHATEEAAARAYDTAALEYFGDFARLNFPEVLEDLNRIPEIVTEGIVLFDGEEHGPLEMPTEEFGKPYRVPDIPHGDSGSWGAVLV